MIIDTHAHLLPQSTLEALRNLAKDFPSVELIEKDEKFQLAFAGGKPTRPIMPKLRLFDPRQQFMAGTGIDLQLPGGWLDSFGYEIPAEEGVDWSRFLNEGMLADCRDRDGVIPLATVPLQSGKLAAQVLREAIKAGMPGAMIGTQPKGGHGNLDDPDLDPFWEMAAELRVPIIIHPMFGSGDARLDDMQMMNAVGRVTDVSIAISRMLFTGHLTRFDGLVVVASTGGGALPYMLGRLERNHKAFPDQVVDPVEQFHKLYFDSIVFQPDVLRFLTAKVGVERVMLGSDYPFPIGDQDPRKVIETAGYSEAEVEAMLTGNARRMFGV
ncbi:MAG: amidohydrolase family protein [Proteobacteria bacterium]|nr:amidohydrolase family protein [Pseudomonadota bacterium]